LDILENSIYNNINGFVISENAYLNNAKIFRVYTDEFGLISIYTKNIEMYLSMYSNYNFKLNYRNEFFYCNEYELLEFFSFKSKEHILFLNILSEIILKTSVPELKNIEIYDLINEVLRIKKIDYKIILSYFIIKYLLFNGYHILFDDEKNIKNYNFDISELLINSSLKYKDKYNYIINEHEYNYIYLLYNSKNLENIDLNCINLKFSRILGILINAFCLNFNIYQLKSFNIR